MTYPRLACAYHECINHPHLKNPIATGSGRYWDLCLDHLLSASILRSAGQAVNRVCSTFDCGWPALYGGLCSRCMAREAETKYQEDRAAREEAAQVCILCGQHAARHESDYMHAPEGWAHDACIDAKAAREEAKQEEQKEIEPSPQYTCMACGEYVPQKERHWHETRRGGWVHGLCVGKVEP